MQPTHYDTLGVPTTTTPDAIRKAYYAIALKHHPDKTQSLSLEQRTQSEVLFKKALAAHEILRDEKKKAAYDRSLQLRRKTPTPAAPPKTTSYPPKRPAAPPRTTSYPPRTTSYPPPPPNTAPQAPVQRPSEYYVSSYEDELWDFSIGITNKWRGILRRSSFFTCQHNQYKHLHINVSLERNHGHQPMDAFAKELIITMRRTPFGLPVTILSMFIQRETSGMQSTLHLRFSTDFSWGIRVEPGPPAWQFGFDFDFNYRLPLAPSKMRITNLIFYPGDPELVGNYTNPPTFIGAQIAPIPECPYTMIEERWPQAKRHEFNIAYCVSHVWGGKAFYEVAALADVLV
ncbi:DnaJ-domain-containing protein [Massarina eburnea CBS 473.64]|uniref:DnaJ-domain-containing protein n=1 Tax=Massarina eburnea CBS 473.64 TaxID=1395130 RepID=A0A6A6S816_9PLEO|nr:DnaJ-domain-containing protein [Massarina eburnea CBS 473.64]